MLALSQYAYLLTRRFPGGELLRYDRQRNRHAIDGQQAAVIYGHQGQLLASVDEHAGLQ